MWEYVLCLIRIFWDRICYATCLSKTADVKVQCVYLNWGRQIVCNITPLDTHYFKMYFPLLFLQANAQYLTRHFSSTNSDVLITYFQDCHAHCNTKCNYCIRNWTFRCPVGNTWTINNRNDDRALYSGGTVNFLAPELFILILAHPVYKMWIIQEPNTLELWNKLHFEEKKKRRVYTMFKIFSTYICWINI